MNLNYLNATSLLFPFPLPHACVFQNQNLFPLFPSLAQRTCAERKEHLLGCPHLLLSLLCSWFPLVFRVPRFACTKQNPAHWFGGYPLMDFFFRGICNPTVLRYMSLVLFFLSSSLFSAPWGWGPCVILVHIPSTGALQGPDEGLHR